MKETPKEVVFSKYGKDHIRKSFDNLNMLLQFSDDTLYHTKSIITKESLYGDDNLVLTFNNNIQEKKTLKRVILFDNDGNEILYFDQCLDFSPNDLVYLKINIDIT